MADLFPDAPVTIAEQIAEVERELGMRAVVYPRNPKKAHDRQMRRLQAVLATLRTVERLLLPLIQRGSHCTETADDLQELSKALA